MNNTTSSVSTLSLDDTFETDSSNISLDTSISDDGGDDNNSNDNNSDGGDDDKISKLMKKEYSYPDQSDPDLQYHMYKKKEFHNNRFPERQSFDNYEEVKNYRDNIGCGFLNGKTITPHSYQTLLTNFINPNTPYKGIIINYGLGAGKTKAGVFIAENFIPQCQKYHTKIVILTPGPLLKQVWMTEIIRSTGEKYLKYIDKSLIMSKEEKEKLNKNAMSLILQFYRFMSYKSFSKHVLGERIIDKKNVGTSTKIKNVYRKNEDGEFERELSSDRIHNLDNTLLIVDEAHQLTGNTLGESLEYIIKNSTNLKVLLITATPMKNLADDIIDLVNFLRPEGNKILRDKVFTSDRNYKMDFKEGGKEYLQNMCSGYFSYVRGADPMTYAKREDQGEIPNGLYFTKVTKCKMNEFQQKVYDATVNELMKEIEDIANADDNDAIDETTDNNADDNTSDDDDNNDNDTSDDDNNNNDNDTSDDGTSDDTELKPKSNPNPNSNNKIDNDALDRKSEAISNFVFPALSRDRKQIVGVYGRIGIETIKKQMREYQVILNKKISKMMYGHEDETKMIYVTEEKRLSGKIYHEDNLKTFSTKFYEALQNIKKLVWGKDGPKTAFIYSNLVKVGIEIFQEILIQNGYLEYIDGHEDYQINNDTVCYYCGKKYNDHQNVLNNVQNEIPSHSFHPATFVTVTGKTADDMGDNIPEEKKTILDNVFSNVNNKEGKYIKCVLGSKIMNEGLSLSHVGDVHILDVYYNLGKVDQAVGRAIRYCSHYKLMNEQNPYPSVKVFKYVITVQNNLSTEEELYKKAELKYIMIKKIERIIKEIAIDCPLNYNGNIFKEEVKKYHGCDKNGEYKCPVECDFTNCEFKCKNGKLNLEFYDPDRRIYKKIAREKLDSSTFNHKLSRNEIEYSKDKIKDMFIKYYSYTIDDILKYVYESYSESKRDLYDEYFVYRALDELIPMTENDNNNFKDTVVDKNNRQGYLIYRGKYYIFQPFSENENVHLYYRTNNDVKMMNNLSLFNYLKINKKLPTITTTSIKNNKSDTDMDDQIYYNFEDAMEYYEKRNEYKYVGFIDKELNKRKDKSTEEIEDVFKLREKRSKILEKKRATGIPSIKGAVCVNAKTKEYLEKVASTLGIETEKRETRQDICKKIETQMLLLEKYSTIKDKNKLTYVMIPTNHPTLQFPYNLEDRIEKITTELSTMFKKNISIKKINSTKKSGPEKGYPSYIIEITTKNKDITNDINDFLKKYDKNIKQKESMWKLEID